MKKKSHQIIINLCKAVFVIGILFYFIKSGKLNLQHLKLFWQTPLMTIAIIGTLSLCIVPLAALRWWLLMRAIDIDVKYFKALALTWIGNFFNVTLPGAITGDLVKAHYIFKVDSKQKTKLFTTLLIDRFIGLFGLIFMAFFALLFNYEFINRQTSLKPMIIMIYLLTLCTIIFYTIVLLPFPPNKDPFILIMKKLPKGNFFIKIYSAFKSYQHRKITLILTLAISLFIHLTVSMLFFYIASLVCHGDITISILIFVMPIGLISVAIPVAPGGIGVGHAAFEYLYKLVGLQGGANVFNLFIIIQLTVFFMGCIPYLLYKNEEKTPEKSSKALP